MGTIQSSILQPGLESPLVVRDKSCVALRAKCRCLASHSADIAGSELGDFVLFGMSMIVGVWEALWDKGRLGQHPQFFLAALWDHPLPFQGHRYL